MRGIIAANGKIKGVAPECELYGVRVFDDNKNATEESIIRGLKWCLDNHIDVVSMSFGSPQQPSSVLHNIIKQLYSAGIMLVSSAGNFGLDFPRMYPASYPEVLSVAAVDIEKRHMQWSSWHETVELAAAGVEVWSTYLNGGYALLSGTSMACPHISGAVAIMIAKRRIRKLSTFPETIRDSMAVYAEDLGDPGRDIKYGYGLFSFGRIEGGQAAPDRPAIDLVFEIGKNKYWKNGVEKQAYIAPVLDTKQNRTLVGLRDVGEAFGCKVDWVAPKIYIKV